MINKKIKSEKSLDDQMRPDTWVDTHGDVLYSYAYLRVREHAQAEDLVQDTFLAALSASKRFQGKSSVRTWLIGILRHKIIDFYRKNIKEQPTLLEEAYEERIPSSSNLNDSWLTGAAKWLSDPSKSLEQKEFFIHFQMALAQLPPRLSQVFILYELDGMPSNDICKLMRISSSNLWVMMYRARMLLKTKLGHEIIEGTAEKNKQPKDQNLSIAKESLSYAATRG